MILFVAVGLAVASVPLCGGRLRRIGTVRLDWIWTVAAALAVQVLIISVLPADLPGPLADALHLGSYALAGIFFWVNRRVPWLWLIGVGGAANLVAISANHGVMPASATALAAAGRARTRHGFANSTWRPGEHLRFLGDIFSIPRSWPLANVFSPGDVLLLVGTLLWLHTIAGSRLRVGRRRSHEASDDTGDGAGRDRGPRRPVGRLVGQLVERLVHLVGRQDEGTGRARQDLVDTLHGQVPGDEGLPVVALPRIRPPGPGLLVPAGLTEGEAGGVVDRPQHPGHVLER